MQRYKYDIRRWTQISKECYMRGCICKGCPVYETYFKDKPKSQQCQVKTAVIETVRRLGITDDMRRNDIIEDI